MDSELIDRFARSVKMDNELYAVWCARHRNKRMEPWERVKMLCDALARACEMQGDHKYEIIKALANELKESLDLLEMQSTRF